MNATAPAMSIAFLSGSALARNVIGCELLGGLSGHKKLSYNSYKNLFIFFPLASSPVFCYLKGNQGFLEKSRFSSENA
jgi:hypothetical protein